MRDTKFILYILIPRKRWFRRLTVFACFFFFFQAQNIPLCLEKLAHRFHECKCFDRSTKSFCTCTAHMYGVRTYFFCHTRGVVCIFRGVRTVVSVHEAPKTRADERSGGMPPPPPPPPKKLLLFRARL